MSTLYLRLGNRRYPIEFNETKGLWCYLLNDNNPNTCMLMSIRLVNQRLIDTLEDRGMLTNILKMISYPRQIQETKQLREISKTKRLILRSIPDLAINTGQYQFHFIGSQDNPDYTIECFDGDVTHFEPDVYTIAGYFNDDINGPYLQTND